MNFQIKNTGTEPLQLSNGSTLASGETCDASAALTVGAIPETTLQSLWDKVHALETRVVEYFEPTPAPAPTPKSPDSTGRN